MSDGRIVSDIRQVDVHEPPPRWQMAEPDGQHRVEVSPR
jgi:hypothetical protein